MEVNGQLTEGWNGSKAGLDAVAKKNVLSPARNQSPGRPARRQVTILTELPRLVGKSFVLINSFIFRSNKKSILLVRKIVDKNLSMLSGGWGK
jgi:hypothetical protein